LLGENAEKCQPVQSASGARKTKRTIEARNKHGEEKTNDVLSEKGMWGRLGK
jgi:hypothetical protein